MPARQAFVPPFATLLALAFACSGKHAIRTPAPDASQSSDGNAAADVIADEPGSIDEGAASEGGTSESLAETGLDEAGPDAAVDQGGGGDLIDGGLDGGGMFQCNFPGSQPGLACSDGQYCSSFIGGPIGSVATYSCALFPAACLTNRTCECLCPKGGTGTRCPDPTRSYGDCTCVPGQGFVTMLCAAP